MVKKETQPILFIEDNEDDYEAAERAFREVNLQNPIYHCETGMEALDFLRRTGKYQDLQEVPLPGMILLDLNLPGLDGRDVLKKIKSEEKFRKIPVIVLTTSNDEQDVNACYEDGANTYIQKPVGLEKLIEAIRRLKEYWFEISLLPKSED